PGFDFIVSAKWAVVLRQLPFERLFRDLALIERHVDDWIKGITDYLPMAPDAVAALREVAVRDTRLWRKLREVRRRGHLAGVTLPAIAKYARGMGLDPKRVVRDGGLVF